MQKIPADRSLSVFIKALTDEYSDVQRDAAIALGILKKQAALNPLQQALNGCFVVSVSLRNEPFRVIKGMNPRG
ncbi:MULTISPECIES: HEAT repeat domain-containing protein [Trichocoleus]|uniref:HEAT repeat domain-containing protein n=1 Tax=Trichocoleus desertorum GB2-A4 TaxID=2933944 RepID=A0ABV0JGA6_9CYAN|nr:HEAT repeat domain-containing protein [Trichocoleus sp. FACHB-46]